MSFLDVYILAFYQICEILAIISLNILSFPSTIPTMHVNPLYAVPYVC